MHNIIMICQLNVSEWKRTSLKLWTLHSINGSSIAICHTSAEQLQFINISIYTTQRYIFDSIYILLCSNWKIWSHQTDFAANCQLPFMGTLREVDILKRRPRYPLCQRQSGAQPEINTLSWGIYSYILRKYWISHRAETSNSCERSEWK